MWRWVKASTGSAIADADETRFAALTGRGAGVNTGVPSPAEKCG